MPLPFSSTASLCHVLSHNGAAVEMTSYKSRDLFFIAMYLSFPIQVKGKEDKMHTNAKGIWRDERHPVRNNRRFYQEWPSFSLSKSVLLLYALNSCHPDTIITPISHWKTGHFTLSFSLHFCNQQLKKRKKEGTQKLFSHFPCCSFLIFYLHSIFLLILS